MTLTFGMLRYGITDTAKYAPMDGSMVAYGIQRMLQVVSDLEVYAVLEIPFYIVAVVLLRRKLAGHRSMLENMASFDIKAAKCLRCRVGNLYFWGY